MEGFEETVYQVTDAITGHEIHIVADDSGTHISIPDDIDVGEVLVADGIAAETVVTTTDVCSGLLSKDDSADSGCGMEELEEGARFADHDSSVSSLAGLGSEDIGMDSLHSTSYETAVWPSLDIIKLKPDMAEDLGSGESLVALIADPVPEDIGTKVKKPREAQIREREKREQDRLKKKLLRSNPDYRQKEKERARARMKLRRLDPVYRCNERQRDRQRRKAARHRNGCNQANRVKEQERVLEGVDAASGFSFAGFEDSYALVESVSQQCEVVENVLSQFDGT